MARPNRFQTAIIKGIGVDRYIENYEKRKPMIPETTETENLI